MRSRHVSELLVTGLLAAALTAPASADDCSDCARTTAHVRAPARVDTGERVPFRVRISSGGEGRPQGEVSLLLTRPDGRALPARTRPYRGDPVTFRTRPRRPGLWRATVVFLAAPGTFWKESVTGTRVRVG